MSAPISYYTGTSFNPDLITFFAKNDPYSNTEVNFKHKEAKANKASHKQVSSDRLVATLKEIYRLVLDTLLFRGIPSLSAVTCIFYNIARGVVELIPKLGSEITKSYDARQIKLAEERIKQDMTQEVGIIGIAYDGIVIVKKSVMVIRDRSNVRWDDYELRNLHKTQFSDLVKRYKGCFYPGEIAKWQSDKKDLVEALKSDFIIYLPPEAKKHPLPQSPNFSHKDNGSSSDEDDDLLFSRQNFDDPDYVDCSDSPYSYNGSTVYGDRNAVEAFLANPSAHYIPEPGEDFAEGFQKFAARQ